jgi:hypothetical protein
VDKAIEGDDSDLLRALVVAEGADAVRPLTGLLNKRPHVQEGRRLRFCHLGWN